jgi:peptide/nickel transport system ATP-binding protein/peptide/nickel transport system permease protein
MSALLEIRGLTVGYGWHFPPAVTAVRDVNLTVHAGEVVGVAGESGSGKSTLAFAATGLLDPPARILSGSVRFDGDEVTTMSREELRSMHFQSASMVFQASMNVLNPVTRIEAQFRDAMAAHGVSSRQEARRRAEEAFDLVKVPRRYLDAYPHQLSGGMRQRAVIALALVMRPKLLVLDEPTTALDVVVERAILQSLDELRHELGFGVIFITHDLSLLVELADRIAIMYAGRLVEEAPARELYESPKHPYTIALMGAFPPLAGERRRLTGIPGQPPDLRNLPPGCPYAPRCPSFIPGVCDVLEPPDVVIDEGRRVLCHLYGSVEATRV